MFKDALLLDIIDAVEHDLVVDRGQSGDDLHEQVQLGIGPLIIVRQDLQNIPIQIESVLQIGDFILELKVFIP